MSTSFVRVLRWMWAALVFVVCVSAAILAAALVVGLAAGLAATVVANLTQPPCDGR
jgi:hypothetical protein